MKTFILSLATLLVTSLAWSQTARVQVIHNSPDDAATEVDVYLNGVLLLNDFAFRNASPFIDAPAGVEIEIDIAPGSSSSVAESIATFPFTLAEDETYVVVADGITGLSATVYNPAPAFNLEVFAMGREAASMMGNTDVLVHHGSTDAPTIDVVEVGAGAGTIVDNASYPGFAGYLELPTADYLLAVRDEEQTVTVATFAAPLATLGLDGAALVTVASGFLDPTMNGDGPAFGLFVALPVGGALIPLPSISNDARVQVIHNSPDDAATEVDVYLNGALLIDDFAFRTASPFIDAPAGVEINIDIAPGASASVDESIANYPLTLTPGETYVVVADGITGLSATAYNPAPAFNLEIFAMGREEASMTGNTDVLVHHGSTDAPTVDVVEVGVGAGTIVDNASYPAFAGYLELPTADYALAVQDMDQTVTVATYAAPLATLGLDGAALVTIASGFLAPSMNGDGPAFGLFVALPAGGELIALPLLPANDNPCGAIGLPVDGSVSTFSTLNATVASGEDIITPPAGTDGCESTDGWCAGDAVIDNSVWFSFVATSEAVDITTCNDGNNFDTQLALFAATDCTDFGTLDFLTGNDDVPGGCDSGESIYASVINYCGLTVGNTYWILVDGYQGDNGDVSISVAEGACPPAIARLQVIHNSAEDIAEMVDVYLNGDLLLDDFTFRTATPFIDAPADVELSIAVAPGTSASVADAIATFPVTLAEGGTYIVVADGITGLSTGTYDPSPAFTLAVYDMGREAATVATNTDVLVHHGSTDAPTVDVAETGVGAGTIVDNASYLDFAGYLELGTDDYELEVQDETGSVTVASYAAPLTSLGLDGAAITVVASGFLDPSANNNGPDFGLWVALASGGDLIPLPVATSVNEIPAVEFALYPNPTENILNLNSTEQVDRIIITDSQGRVVVEIAGIQRDIDVSGLAPGVYQVTARVGERQSAQLLMKQ